MKRCNNIDECIEKHYKNYISKVNYRWILGICIGIIILILTYKLWNKNEPIQTLISVGTGLISIALGIFAIIYAVAENIKANNKENKVDVILDEIESQVDNMNNIVKKISSNTEVSLDEIINIKNNNKEIMKSIKGFNFEQYNQKVNKNTENTKVVSSEIEAEITVKKDDKRKIILRKFQKGDICLVDLKNEGDSLIRGKRLVIIIQNSILNKYAPSLTIVPLTGLREDKKLIPTHIQFERNDKLMTAVVEQITTIKQNDILDFIDRVDIEIMSKIDNAILFQLGIKEV
ncbi:type II toxin-antitoxin system PemK/MazF family toxin [Clostridium felsineum]|uniref:type II toxin-antitoxin system PemK/MazF family toxin n=1 Tax=Clostridium felsineum TaxID=36839 RepID=UPI0009D2A596|nr:type II toxin-antitoxin system PemK/MazF family toxin [Clostridium felsineum]URZ15785.1 hypothetical protein CLFE_018320 [Clostridium felsineum DSM 794]